MVAYSFKMFLKGMRINPIGVFNLEDNSHEFEIERPGYYSISILGAGFVRELQRVTIKLTLNNVYDLEVGVHMIAPRFRKDSRMGIEYWGFSTSGIGRCTITLSNMEYIEAYDSMLIPQRVFESPIDHSKLKVIIHPSLPPIHKVASVFSLILGVWLVVAGILVWI